jgi:hypothetical protein
VSLEVHQERRIPKGVGVHHLCHNKRCINPKHLSTGNQTKNITDSYTDGKVEKKLSIAQVKEIRRRAEAGEKKKALAKEYGVSAGHVGDIVNRVVWKEV